MRQVWGGGLVVLTTLRKNKNIPLIELLFFRVIIQNFEMFTICLQFT